MSSSQILYLWTKTSVLYRKMLF